MSVVDIAPLLIVRKMPDWRIQNFLWYFNNCDGAWTGDLRMKLADACLQEAERRGLEYDGKLSIG